MQIPSIHRSQFAIPNEKNYKMFMLRKEIMTPGAANLPYMMYNIKTEKYLSYVSLSRRAIQDTHDMTKSNRFVKKNSLTTISPSTGGK